MIKQVRMAVLDQSGSICTFLDNDAPDALHYYDDLLHEYLKGSANTLEFKTTARHPDSIFLVVGGKISFQTDNRSYYFNIMSVERDEYEVSVEAHSLSLELLNEQLGAYKASSAMSFTQYVGIFDCDRVLTIGVNEVSSSRITCEWTGSETILGRLFSLATMFSAELEFVPELNDNYTLNQIVMNVYKQHTDTYQGIGQNRKDIVLRYGVDIEGITKKTDITELYTLIRPVGRDGLTISSLNKTEYDSDGNIEFRSPSGDKGIYAVKAREQFPSNLMAGNNNRWIAVNWDYDTDNANTLYGQALAQLKKNCQPAVQYDVKGYFDTGIGDTVMIEDEEFNPILYLEARVTEQKRSFTDASRNETVFDNFKEKQSQIDDSILARVQALIEANAAYQLTIVSSEGTQFKGEPIITTLSVMVYRNGQKLNEQYLTDNNLQITWTGSDGSTATGMSISVSKADFELITYGAKLEEIE